MPRDGTGRPIRPHTPISRTRLPIPVGDGKRRRRGVVNNWSPVPDEPALLSGIMRGSQVALRHRFRRTACGLSEVRGRYLWSESPLPVVGSVDIIAGDWLHRVRSSALSASRPILKGPLPSARFHVVTASPRARTTDKSGRGGLAVAGIASSALRLRRTRAGCFGLSVGQS